MKVWQKTLCGVVCSVGFLCVAGVADAKSTPLPKAQWSGLLKNLDKAEKGGKDQKGMMEMVLVNKAGQKRRRRAIFFQKGAKKRVVQFKYPPNQAGLTVLVKGRSIQLYLPQFRKIRRVAAHVKNQGFMGSDLSMDDLSTTSYKGSHTVLAAHKNDKGYKLVLKPQKGSYSKLVVHLRKDYQVRQIRYFNKQGKAIKLMVRSDFRKIKKYLFPHKLIVKNLVTGHKTIVNMSKIEMDSGIPSKYFTRRYLKRELDL